MSRSLFEPVRTQGSNRASVGASGPTDEYTNNEQDMIYLNSAMHEDERSNRGDHQIAMFETNHKLRHSSVDAISGNGFFFDNNPHEYSSVIDFEQQPVT